MENSRKINEIVNKIYFVGFDQYESFRESSRRLMVAFLLDVIDNCVPDAYKEEVKGNIKRYLLLKKF